MKIISWNVNSLRIRIENIIEILENEKPDIFCLQETKVNNSLFPKSVFEDKGYFAYFNGISSYNGVAILSKKKAEKIINLNLCDKDDARFISIEIDGVEFISIYVPAGGDDPDPSSNPKFRHKLNFLDEMLKILTKKKSKKLILCGDLNIAPHEDDVWSHKNLVNVVSHTEIERKKLKQIIENCNLTDSTRFFINPPENVFTWWSYRSPNFEINNRGRRLDHIFTSSCLSKNFKCAKILKYFRKRKRPSDHVPVSLELNLN